MNERQPTWLGRVQRGTSPRVILIALLLGAIAGWLASTVWAPASVPVTLVAAAAVWLLIVSNDSQMVTCDACRKRVKLGAGTCHHCGYTRA